MFTFEVKSWISLLFCLRFSFIILGHLIATSLTKTCRKLFFTKVVLCSRAVWVVWEQALGSQWGRQVAQLGAERSLPPKIESPISIHSLLALAMKAGSPLCCHSLLIHNCGLVPAATDRTQPVVRERVVCGDWAPSLVSVPTPLPVESGAGNWLVNTWGGTWLRTPCNYILSKSVSK